MCHVNRLVKYGSAISVIICHSTACRQTVLNERKLSAQRARANTAYNNTGDDPLATMPSRLVNGYNNEVWMPGMPSVGAKRE